MTDTTTTNGPVPPPALGHVPAAEAELRTQLAAAQLRAEGLQRQLGEQRQRWMRDINTIGRSMIEEADRRGFCQDYDEWVDDINRSLQHELPRRVREWELTGTVYVTVDAASLDEAREMADEVMSNGDGEVEWEES